MAGCRSLARLCGVIALLSLGAAAFGSVATADAGNRTGEIVVGLPSGGGHDVSLTFGEGKVSLAVPAGSTFPLDFERASQGLLRAGEVVTVDPAHLRLDLRLASGVVDGIDVTPTSVVVKLRRRFVASDDTAKREDDYALGVNDKIQVSINGDPKLTQQIVIGPDGRASLPLVGDVTLGGLTHGEAVSTITELLARDYLVDPKVDLQILEFKSQWVMVTGEVGKPGRVPLRGGPTLKDALADADGMTGGAGDEIVISRDAPDGAGKVQIAVGREEFERAEVNPALKTGDIVSVPARPYVYVQGEVKLPNKVPLERGMTLMKAISIVGGLTEWASEKGVQIMSEGATGKQRLFNLKDIRSMHIPDPALKGGDVIYVKRRFL